MICGYSHETLEYIPPIYDILQDVFKFENYWLMQAQYRINIPKLVSKFSLDYKCHIKCTLCLQKDIGDEYQYLIWCDYVFTR